MALVQNSYRYHTMLDTADAIEPGAVQHMGDNVLALLEYLTSPETTMGNSAKPTPVLPRAPTSHTIFFSALGGKVFVVYSRATATVLYGILAALVAVVVTDRVDWSKDKKVYILSVVGVLGGLLSSIIGANLAAAALSLCLGRSMTWCVILDWPSAAGLPVRCAGSATRPTRSSCSVLPLSSPSSSTNTSLSRTESACPSRRLRRTPPTPPSSNTPRLSARSSTTQPSPSSVTPWESARATSSPSARRRACLLSSPTTTSSVVTHRAFTSRLTLSARCARFHQPTGVLC